MTSRRRAPGWRVTAAWVATSSMMSNAATTRYQWSSANSATSTYPTSTSCATARTAPTTRRCARPTPCHRAMPTARRMSPNGTPRSNQDTSTMARLAVGVLWSKGIIRLVFHREKRPQPRVGRALEHVRGLPTGHDAPLPQNDGSIATAARFGQAMRDHDDGQVLLPAQAADRLHQSIRRFWIQG